MAKESSCRLGKDISCGLAIIVQDHDWDFREILDYIPELGSFLRWDRSLDDGGVPSGVIVELPTFEIAVALRQSSVYLNQPIMLNLSTDYGEKYLQEWLDVVAAPSCLRACDVFAIQHGRTFNMIKCRWGSAEIVEMK